MAMIVLGLRYTVFVVKVIAMIVVCSLTYLRIIIDQSFLKWERLKLTK